jgi:threonine synthase
MQYYSLNTPTHKVSFKQATIAGQAPDRGLYFPEALPKFNSNFIKNIAQTSNEAIAFEVMAPFVAGDMDKKTLENILAETINFNTPLKQVTQNIFSLELYHGPTLAFKDIGARFMSRCLAYFVKTLNKKITVLVATSGDTGGAVANGFFNVNGVEVIILYPSGKVSSVQEKQLTTLGKNITALEVNGTFDDCQQMVKDAFLDTDLNKKYFLTSANSINVARWLPQQLYYLFAYKQWQNKTNAPVLSVPSGNFGNICAGVLAHIRGMPVQHFIAACNANNVVPNFFATGNFQIKPSVATISNAMDVANPSNFVRVMQMFSNQLPQLKNIMSSTSTTDVETAQTLLDVFTNYNYLCDPHGAVAFNALNNYLNKNKQHQGIFLETAHPIKFYDVVEPIIATKLQLPNNLAKTVKLPKQSIFIENKQLKNYLLSR